MTKLATTLPKGEANGLDSLARKLIDAPDEVQVVVALIDCKEITTETDTGDILPTARIRRIEGISGDDKTLVVQLLRRALEQRTGKTVLPFDLEEDLRALGLKIDPNTGEPL